MTFSLDLDRIPKKLNPEDFLSFSTFPASIKSGSDLFAVTDFKTFIRVASRSSASSRSETWFCLKWLTLDLNRNWNLKLFQNSKLKIKMRTLFTFLRKGKTDLLSASVSQLRPSSKVIEIRWCPKHWLLFVLFEQNCTFTFYNRPKYYLHIKNITV